MKWRIDVCVERLTSSRLATKTNYGGGGDQYVAAKSRDNDCGETRVEPRRVIVENVVDCLRSSFFSVATELASS